MEPVSPDVIVYVCTNCIPRGGRLPRQWRQDAAHVLVREVPCSGKMDGQYLLHALEGGGNYVPLPNLAAKPIDAGVELFPPERAKVEAKVGVNPSEVDALHVAIGNEIESFNLYKNAAQETSDEAGKQMYTWLAQAELGHFNLLMTNYESLVAMGGWV